MAGKTKTITNHYVSNLTRGLDIIELLVQQALVASIDLPRFNERTITDPEKLLEELARVRELAYALDRAEEHEGVHCIASPILDVRGYPAAALTTTGPADRLTLDRLKPYGELVRDCARDISARFGSATDMDGEAAKWGGIGRRYSL